MADGTWIYADLHRQHRPLPSPKVPRCEVLDELHAALRQQTAPLHDGPWARGTLQACLAILDSARLGRDVELQA